MTTKVKQKSCRVCKEKFFPQRSTLEVVCGIKCAIELSKAKVKLHNDQVWNKEKLALKEKLKSLSDWKNELQVIINDIVRTIDRDWGCIATNSIIGKKNAGHYISCGSNDTLRFHLENIWLQSEHSNMWKSGDTIRYQEGIISLFGKKYLDYINGLQSLKPTKLNSDDIKEKIPVCRSILKWLKLQDRKFTLEERLSLRKKFNLEIGIYK